jgi:hypothetical protein
LTRETVAPEAGVPTITQAFFEKRPPEFTGA